MLYIPEMVGIIPFSWVSEDKRGLRLLAFRWYMVCPCRAKAERSNKREIEEQNVGWVSPSGLNPPYVLLSVSQVNHPFE